MYSMFNQLLFNHWQFIQRCLMDNALLLCRYHHQVVINHTACATVLTVTQHTTHEIQLLAIHRDGGSEEDQVDS